MPGSALIRLGALAHAFSLLAAAAGCYESQKYEVDGQDALDAPAESIDQVSDGLYLDCPAPEDFRIWISVDPFEVDRIFASAGKVTAVEKDADGWLLIALDLSASGEEPSEVIFRMPILEGVDVDLHPGEEVEVEYSYYDYFFMDGVDLRILKNDETVIQAGSCRHDCIHDSLVIPPLSLSLISGRCERQLDELGCAFYERLGYSISCESGNEEVEVFDHGYAYVPCGPGYHVILGAFDRIVERIEPGCMDIASWHARMIVIRHGDGLASSGP